MFVTMSLRQREGKTKMKESQVFMKWFEEQLLPSLKEANVIFWEKGYSFLYMITMFVVVVLLF